MVHGTRREWDECAVGNSKLAGIFFSLGVWREELCNQG